MFILVKRNTIRIISLVIAVLFALPLGWGKLSGFWTWLSPFILLNSVFALKSFVFMNVAGISVLAAVWLKKRFFCKYLCPMGCMLDRLPKSGKQNGNHSIKAVPSMGRYLAVISLTGAVIGFPIFIFLDPVAVFNGFCLFLAQFSWLTVLTSVTGLLLLVILQLIWPGLWCKKLCPTGGMQLLVSDLKALLKGTNPSVGKKELGRRIFIGSTIGVVGAMLFPFVAKGKEDKLIRPPASVKPEDFYALCTRCGSCVKACPTKIIKQGTSFGFGLLTPEVKFDNGYCLENCNDCGVVCPSGAITLFSVSAKPQLIMGSAFVNGTNCLLAHQTECDRCKQVCAYKAIMIRGEEKGILNLPEVDSVKCVGCGACKIVCPKNCISIM